MKSSSLADAKENDNESPKSCSSETFNTNYQKLICTYIEQEDFPRLWDTFRRLKTQLDKGIVDSQLYIKFIFCQIVKCLYEHIQKDASAQLIETIESIYQAGNLDTIYKIVEKCIQNFEQSCHKTDHSVQDDIAQLILYIANHLDENLSIDTLAAKVYLSQGYLSLSFKQATGMTISRYIKKCRMERAKELLSTTNMRLAEICETLGFSNVSYFCQSFRDYCDISPDQYRKRETKD